MKTPVIGFIPPVVGTEGEFNTFRLGGKYASNLKPGDEVFLMEEKSRHVFGKAQVIRVELGSLGEMCLVHAPYNHTELILEDRKTAGAERLFKLLQRIYGPHIATAKKKTSVIYLRRIE